MRPQSYWGGCTPSPRKLSPASASSASPVVEGHRDQQRFRDVRENVPAQSAAGARRRACAPQRGIRSLRPTTRASGSGARSTARLRPRCRSPRRSRRRRSSPRRRSRASSAGNATVRLMNPVNEPAEAAADERGHRSERDADRAPSTCCEDGEQSPTAALRRARDGRCRDRARRCRTSARCSLPATRSGCRSAMPRPTRGSAR